MAMIREALAGELAVLRAIDDDATRLYYEAGVPMVLTDEHAFVRGETERWRRALCERAAFLGVDARGEPQGFIALSVTDGEPYLEQIAVRRAAMGRGLGTALLAQAIEWSAARGPSLWLTTYRHLRWNAPWYARHDFQEVPEAQRGALIKPATVCRARAPRRACRGLLFPPCWRSGPVSPPARRS
jgi:GNAT superfamily N-acetyltransferase